MTEASVLLNLIEKLSLDALKRLQRSVVLLTDFGTNDGSAACLEGVITSINPFAKIIHMSHDIPNWDIATAAMFLEVYVKYYPKGTIFLSAVDPGVGTSRKILLAECGGYFFVGPDNGIFGRVFEKFPPRIIVSLTEKQYWLLDPSKIFHARDIMAPVCGHLSKGVSLPEFGVEIQRANLVKLNPFSRSLEDRIETKVLYVDGFGNLVIGITTKEFDIFLGTSSFFQLRIGDHSVTEVAEYFAKIKPKEIALIFGGDFGDYGTIAMNMSSAAELIGAKEGTFVLLTK